MNLADYLSELLGKYNEVSMPGLGYFVRERVNAYYNDAEARFYPPYHRIKFVPEFKEDEIFVRYVADKKNISMASAKYFTEKHVGKLREEAARGKYLFSGLGTFQSEQGQLVFKPHERVAADPAVYGFSPIEVQRLTKAPVAAAPVVPQPPARQSLAERRMMTATVPSPPVQTIRQPQYFDEDVEVKKKVNYWFIVLIVLVVLGLGVFGLYKFYPPGFEWLQDEFHQVFPKEEPRPPIYKPEFKVDPLTKEELKRDSAHKDSLRKDSLRKSPLPLSDSEATFKPVTKLKIRWEVIEFGYDKMPYAQDAVRKLKAKGVDAKILTDATGPKIKVSVGTYKNAAQADSARIALVKAGKLRKDSKTLPITIQ